MNLKSKLPLLRSQENLTEILKNRKMSVLIPKPTQDLYNFKGLIEFNYGSTDEESQVEELNLV